MPNRILNDSVCRSESMAQLSWFDQCVFSRLIVLADDFGRYDARPAIIKGSGFPLHRDLTEEEIASALKRIEAAGMILLYTVDEKNYLQLNSWHKFQRLRNSKEKYPAPPGYEPAQNDGPNADCGNSPQLAATRRKSPQVAATRRKSPSESESQSNSNPIRIQSESNLESEEESEEESELSLESESKGDLGGDDEKKMKENFETFWKAYPKHKDKPTVRAEFQKVKVPFERLMAALEKQKASENWKKDNGRWIPSPSYWLRDERWEDSEYSTEPMYTEELPI